MIDRKIINKHAAERMLLASTISSISALDAHDTQNQVTSSFAHVNSSEKKSKVCTKPTQMMPCDALLSLQRLLHDGLCGDTSMVSARHPHRVVATHATPTHNRVLQAHTNVVNAKILECQRGLCNSRFLELAFCLDACGGIMTLSAMTLEVLASLGLKMQLHVCSFLQTPT